MAIDWQHAAADLIDGLLARTHLSLPSDAATVIAEEAQRALDATDVVVYWVNRERTMLVPIPDAVSAPREQQPVDGSIAGRAFASSEVLTRPGTTEGRRRVYVPVMDGTDRVGVLALEVPLDVGTELTGEQTTVLERFGHATAMILVAKKAYGDSLELVQRSRPMDLGAELLWSVLPPLTYATDGLVVSAMLEPAYENGGDGFDYAVNEDHAHFAILDGVGHGLAAARLSTFSIAAYRHSRRLGRDLVESYTAMDDAVSEHFGDDAFVTAVLARLDRRSGRLEWVNAGHPPPLLLRGSHVVKTLEAPPVTPLGMPLFGSQVRVAREQLEPGDTVVLYTDGVTEARRPDGAQLGAHALGDFLEREAAAGQSPPETLRRLQRVLLSGDEIELSDDATVLLFDWRRGSEQLLVPQTV